LVGGVSIDGPALVASHSATCCSTNRVADVPVLPDEAGPAGWSTRPGATVDPLFISGYIPRSASVLPPTPRLAKPPASLQEPRGSNPREAILTAANPSATTHLDPPLSAGTIVRFAPGWWLDGSGINAASQAVALGEDLLWTGSFEGHGH
jgi:hypothetical protein